QCAPAPRDSNSSRSESSEWVRKIEQREPIPYPTLRRTSSEVRNGSSKTVRAGINGEKKLIYRVTTRQDEEVQRELIASQIVKQPVPEVLIVGSRSAQISRGNLPSRGYFSGRKTFTMI